MNIYTSFCKESLAVIYNRGMAPHSDSDFPGVVKVLEEAPKPSKVSGNARIPFCKIHVPNIPIWSRELKDVNKDAGSE